MEKDTGESEFFTQENLANVGREELVKIILEQQAKLKDDGNDHAHRKRKHEEISTSPAKSGEVRFGSFSLVFPAHACIFCIHRCCL
jgi:hypothetical protein